MKRTLTDRDRKVLGLAARLQKTNPLDLMLRRNTRLSARMRDLEGQVAFESGCKLRGERDLEAARVEAEQAAKATRVELEQERERYRVLLRRQDEMCIRWERVVDVLLMYQKQL